MNQNSENGQPSLISVPVKRPWKRRVFILTILLLSAAGAGIYKTGLFYRIPLKQSLFYVQGHESDGYGLIQSLYPEKKDTDENGLRILARNVDLTRPRREHFSDPVLEQVVSRQEAEGYWQLNLDPDNLSPAFACPDLWSDCEAFLRENDLYNDKKMKMSFRRSRLYFKLIAGNTMTLSGAELDFVESWLEKVNPALDQFKQAVRQESFFVPVVEDKRADFPSLPAAYISFGNRLVDFVRALTVRVKYRLAHQDTDGALDDLIAILELANHLLNQPVSFGVFAGKGTNIVYLISKMDLTAGGTVDWTPEQQTAFCLTVGKLPRRLYEERIFAAERIRCMDLVEWCSGQRPEKIANTIHLVNPAVPEAGCLKSWLFFSNLDWNIVVQQVLREQNDRSGNGKTSDMENVEKGFPGDYKNFSVEHKKILTGYGSSGGFDREESSNNAKPRDIYSRLLSRRWTASCKSWSETVVDFFREVFRKNQENIQVLFEQYPKMIEKMLRGDNFHPEILTSVEENAKSKE